MGRLRKDYRLVPTPEPLIGKPGTLVVNMLDGDGKLERSFDFSAYAARPVMAAEIALAFRQHHADKCPDTRKGAFQALRTWFGFLEEHGTPIETMRDVDSGVLRAYIAWLDRKEWGKGTQHGAWSVFKQLVAWLKRNHPERMQPDLEIPFNAFPRKNAATRPREVLDRTEMEEVLAAARRDIEASWATFATGQTLLSEIDHAAVAAERDLGKLDLENIGVLLAIIVNRCGGVVPPDSISLRKGSGLRRIYIAAQKHGGNRQLVRYLHAIPETLIPYMIAIGAQSYANPEALRHLRRDCMNEHLLLDGRTVVTWSKGRSNRQQRRSFLRDKSLSVPNLIERVLAMTAPLVPHAPAPDRDRLFLVDSMNNRRTVLLIPNYLVEAHVRKFVRRHSLLNGAGSLMALTMATLRPSGLTLAHETLGYDILKTQALANHATPDTTQRYVDRPVVRRAQERVIGSLQARFVELVRTGSYGEPIEIEPEATDAEHATAAGFICSDPFGGVGNGQKVGRLCTAWLGCFTCPNAVIPLDPDVLARLLSTRAALIEARAALAPDRWRLLYAPKLEILDNDILPRFPSELRVAALGKQTPVLPPIE